LIALPFGFVVFALMQDHADFIVFSPEELQLNLSPLLNTAACALCGAVIGMVSVEEFRNFRKDIEVRTLAGAVAAGFAPWCLEFYLWMRGNPSSIYQIEFILVIIMALVPGAIIFLSLKSEESNSQD
jgi:hypothetical protein